MPYAKYDPYDLIATDLAYWLEDMSDQLAAAMAPQGVAPFAALLTEGQKLEYYRAQLFNPDGSPNMSGRTQEMNRMGPQGFRQVYTAVIKAYPDLRIPAPPPGAQMPTIGAPPGPPPPGPPPPGPPPEAMTGAPPVPAGVA
jgi:hypothetical protein